jgi:uroporphyrin-III C-methyltransferase
MGKVYLVGAGPGAPDLLTIRAARILAAADIVLHDALVHPDTLKLAAKARFIDVGKRYGKVSTEQRFIHRALIEAARTHAVVVRLKGGDPMMFGRAHEELDALAAAGIETEVVPGVTAALAAASTLKVSLTRRGIARTVSFLTPRVGKGETASEWLPAAMSADTVVLYMAAGAGPEIARALIGRRKTPIYSGSPRRKRHARIGTPHAHPPGRPRALRGHESRRPRCRVRGRSLPRHGA